MGATRLTVALDRIDRALARLESSSQVRPPSGDLADAHSGEADFALRGKIEEAIARLDNLLADAGQG